MGNNSPIFVLSCTGVTSACLRYGQLYANEHLAKAVIYFYDNAWAASTTRTYKTGQRHWASFIASFPAIPHYPFPHTLPRQFELALAFFAAHLALQPTITRIFHCSSGTTTHHHAQFHRGFIFGPRPHGVAQGWLHVKIPVLPFRRNGNTRHP